MTLMANKPTPREILFEMTAMGASVKVVAIDTHTGLEASIIGPAKAGSAMLQQSAMRKLEYLLKKKQEK